MNVYYFEDYRELILAILEQKIGRGSKMKLAEILNCRPGYISQVLNKSKIHFSSENIIKIAQFLNLSQNEEEYLFNLLYFARAGSVDLKKFYERKIKLQKKEHLNIKSQIQEQTSKLDDISKATYYSHWSYCAIHMLVSIDEFKKLEKISNKLKLDHKHTLKVLTFLEEKGLIQKNKTGYEIGKTRIHLDNYSPLIKSHHQNFRNKAIQNLEEENDFNLHYSSVMTLSKSDADKIRSLILKLISENERILLPSKNEEMICLNVDLFNF